jgi:hypothetical protein
MKYCDADDCTREREYKLYCSMHWKRWKRHGHTERLTGKHGRGIEDPTYSTWRSMKMRCCTVKSTKYKYYGAKGIKVCARWLGADGFKNFLADMGERPTGKTIDRIDNDGDYEPSNCRWANKHQQASNQRVKASSNCGIPGVQYNKRTGKWVAVVTILGDRIYLGTFKNMDKAIAIRKEAELHRDAIQSV